MLEEDKIVEQIRGLAEKMGRTPRLVDLRLIGLPKCKVLGHYPSWNEAVRAAGLRPNRETRKYRKWTAEACISAIKEVWELCGHRISTQLLRDFADIAPPPRVLARIFGSVEIAFRVAGVAPEPGRRLHVPGLEAARAWMNGMAACGILIAPEALKRAMGEDAYGIVEALNRGMSLRAAAREWGIPPGRARKVLVDGLKKAAELLPEKERPRFFRGEGLS